MTLTNVLQMIICCCELYQQKGVDDTQKVYIKVDNKLYNINHMYFDDDKNLIIGNDEELEKCLY